MDDLSKLSRDIEQWADANLTKYPQRHAQVYIELATILDEAKYGKHAREAALAGLHCMWHLLFEDADRGFRVRHGGKQVLPHEKAPSDTIKRMLDQLHAQHPDYSVTKLRKIVSEALGIGRSTLLAKTKYNPLDR